MFIAPTGTEDQVFKGKEQDVTPSGTYQMKVIARAKDGSNLLSVTKTKAGNNQLNVLLGHIDGAFKPVRAKIALDGVDKNGQGLGRAFKQFLYAIGIDEASRNAPTTGADVIGDAPAGEEWKGAPATIVVNGDTLDINEKTLAVAVVQEEYNGKPTVKANSFYPAKA